MRTKRLLLLLLTAVMTLGGCSIGGGGGSSDNQITLTLWYWNRSLDDSIIAEAEQQFPNLHIRAQKSEAISSPS
ncbi:hypothetical protein PACILC2_17140 [Paenibacillus cisolokensis]|uniref:Sugar ABC transporter substrate-binding protein n=1 Tax=Paenibacillus cisolokensis TaxID=1658519 RepID=A0ABQ4N4S0_9BACL|nr:hypothetical protein [Paenibacillus cisolokensis]GIQ63146.1 hypothetical protein PACILC2_17140 [Paenibacillus cisolokensis]